MSISHFCLQLSLCVTEKFKGRVLGAEGIKAYFLWGRENRDASCFAMEFDHLSQSSGCSMTNLKDGGRKQSTVGVVSKMGVVSDTCVAAFLQANEQEIKGGHQMWVWLYGQNLTFDLTALTSQAGLKRF